MTTEQRIDNIIRDLQQLKYDLTVEDKQKRPLVEVNQRYRYVTEGSYYEGNEFIVCKAATKEEYFLIDSDDGVAWDDPVDSLDKLYDLQLVDDFELIA